MGHGLKSQELTKKSHQLRKFSLAGSFNNMKKRRSATGGSEEQLEPSPKRAPSPTRGEACEHVGICWWWFWDQTRWISVYMIYIYIIYMIYLYTIYLYMYIIYIWYIYICIYIYTCILYGICMVYVWDMDRIWIGYVWGHVPYAVSWLPADFWVQVDDEPPWFPIHVEVWPWRLLSFGQNTTRWCPSSLAKLVYKSYNYGLWYLLL